MSVVSKDLLSQFNSWGDQQRRALLRPYISTDLYEDIEQKAIFQNDFKRHIHDMTVHTKYEVASIAQCIATLVLTLFAPFGEFYRFCSGSIDASTCVANICRIPKHIIIPILIAPLHAIKALNKSVSAASIGTGFLTWHGGEKLVRWVTGSPRTTLSNNRDIRDIVYNALGITLLAAAAVFVPIPTIQLISLPIILGSIYGTINNQFTVRECPEYYTMGHYYDGTNLRGHAVKTNSLWIKPIITGCYATTTVTKIAGIALAAVGRLPYTAAALPVPLAAAMIAGSCVVSLVAAHIFATMKKNSIQKNLDDYAKLINIEWNEENRNRAWGSRDLILIRSEAIEKKRRELESNPQELEKFEEQLLKLTKDIESNILFYNLPVKYVVGWQTNNIRNSVGYLFAGGGTVALAISTVFLRIFAF